MLCYGRRIPLNELDARIEVGNHTNFNFCLYKVHGYKIPILYIVTIIYNGTFNLILFPYK